MCTPHFCVVCGDPVDFHAAARVSQASRSCESNTGNGLVCDECKGKVAKRNARNSVKRGAETPVLDFEYRFTIPCEYTLRTKAEFCKAKWLACDGAIKSPKLHNMMWTRKLETMDKLVASGDMVLTGKVSVSILLGSDVLECEKVEYEGKAEFLAFVRELVEHHKALAYLEAYGKTLGYKLRD